MYFYCEECGAKIIPGSRFCEECGTPVPKDEVFELEQSAERSANVCAEYIFEKENWRDLWAECEGLKGLIVFNPLTYDIPAKFSSTLEDYISFSNNRGILYYPLNLQNQKVCTLGSSKIDSILLILREIYSVSKPDYLLLIGDKKSIGDISWANKSYDGDQDVYSDLPYVTFDTETPFSGGRYQFSDAVSVGRIPSSPKDKYALAINYLNNAIKNVELVDKDRVFGLSAYQWKDESRACFGEIGENLLLSPSITLRNLQNDGVVGLNNGVIPNLMYFNLHGSDQTKYWYGQQDTEYPEVVAPKIMKGHLTGYFLGVEACYGAKYENLDVDDSILLTALDNGCLSFLGSSKIAYGTSQEPGCCADIVIRTFLARVKNGYTAGQAYLDSLTNLCKEEMNDAAIKTMAEFALYGDPSLSIDSISSKKQVFKQNERWINVPMPDISNAVRYNLASVSEKINAKLSEYLKDYHKDFIGAKVIHLKSINNNCNQSIYERECKYFKQFLKLYYDENGNIKGECLSK